MRTEAFSAQVLGRPLWPHQVEVAESEAFITVVAKARRTGGTELAEDMACATAFSERNVKVLILSATQDASRRVTESIGQKLAANRLTRGAVVDDYATRIRLTNGSEIISLPASQRQVRGYGKGVRLVILDEAGFMPQELYAAASYTALDERPRSRILMVGTPWGGADHFFRRAFVAGQEGDPDHASFHWTFAANPSLDHAYLERQRQRVSPAEYHAEVLGEWSDAIGALFPRDLLERSTVDLAVEPSGPARPIVALDFGVSFDRSAAVLLYRLAGVQHLNDCSRATFVVVPRVWPAGARLGAVVEAVAEWGLPYAYVASETNGVGAMPSQELYRLLSGQRPRRIWNLVNTTAAKKTAGYGCILGLLESGQLVLPRHPELLRQLAGLRFEQGERGFTRIEADNPAVHDDVADALYLASLPVAAKSGRIVCQLAALANPRRAHPEADLPERFDGEIVTTPSGLRLYRRPPLQSVAGSELSLPPQGDQSEPTTVGRFTVKARSTP